MNTYHFKSRGLNFISGPYGAYFLIHIKASVGDQVVQAVRDSLVRDEYDHRLFRNSEFSRSLLLEPLEDSKNLQESPSYDSRLLIDRFLQRDLWDEEGELSPGIKNQLNRLLLKDEEGLEWNIKQDRDSGGETGAELIEKEKQRLLKQKMKQMKGSRQLEISLQSSTPTPDFDGMRFRTDSGQTQNASAKKVESSKRFSNLQLNNSRPRVREDSFATSDLNEPLVKIGSSSEFHTVVEYESAKLEGLSDDPITEVKSPLAIREARKASLAYLNLPQVAEKIAEENREASYGAERSVWTCNEHPIEPAIVNGYAKESSGSINKMENNRIAAWEVEETKKLESEDEDLDTRERNKSLNSKDSEFDDLEFYSVVESQINGGGVSTATRKPFAEQ